MVAVLMPMLNLWTSVRLVPLTLMVSGMTQPPIGPAQRTSNAPRSPDSELPQTIDTGPLA
ncbi:Uncharacterised protein [Mycobacterium tuberculosis]|nr:Uncharacterised protein [Mycobacterium tuberculosis]